MQTTTAKIISPLSKAPRFLHRAVNHQGYLAQVKNVGKGKIIDQKVHWGGGDADVEEIYEKYVDIMVPFFNGQLVKEDNIQQEITSFMETAENKIENVIGTKFEKYLLKWGEQEGGYSVIDSDAEQNKKREETLKTVGTLDNPIMVSTDMVGHRINVRLPENQWNIVKPFADYFKANEDDMEWLDDMGYIDIDPREVKGWHYKAGFVEALRAKGLVVKMGNEAINTTDDILAVDKKHREEHRQYIEKRTAYEKELHVINQAIRENSVTATPEQVEIAEASERILIHDWTGPDIYGGGKWLHIIGEDLYPVHNNGMDGDNWSWNNYTTGGAGAICNFVKDGKKYYNQLLELKEKYTGILTP